MSDTLYWQAQGKALSKRYKDIVLTENRPKDNRSAEEIARDVIANCGIEVRA